MSRYLDAVIDKLLNLVHGTSGQQLLRIGGWAHVARVQEVQQLLSCSKPATVLQYPTRYWYLFSNFKRRTIDWTKLQGRL